MQQQDHKICRYSRRIAHAQISTVQHQNQQQAGMTTYRTQQATTRTVKSGPSTNAYPHHNFPHTYQFSTHNSNHSQGSNAQEYHLLLEEAREIRYTGRCLPFIFYYNQISELLRRCSDFNRHMDRLRASCLEEAREAISALVPPVPGWSNDTQVKRALEALHLRYGCCSFLSEPLVKQVRSGPKIHKIDVSTLLYKSCFPTSMTASCMLKHINRQIILIARS